MSTSQRPSVDTGGSGAEASNEDKAGQRPPLPSTSAPLAIACSCLNVTIAARVPDDLKERLDSAPRDTLEPVWLPRDAETIMHREMSTFLHEGGDADRKEAWRKCWVCGIKVYRTTDKKESDMAPSECWVEVDFNSGVVYGDKYEKTVEKEPLPFSGLRLDLPSTSNFGRPPREATPTPYPVNGATSKLLPPIPDPFFLPPPFIPSHAILRDMCRAAVETLHEKHDEIQRDIAEYVAKRGADMRRLEDQVRAEVESLWTRYSEGPGGGDSALQRRGSLSAVTSPRDRSRSPAVARASASRDRKGVSSPSRMRPAVPTTDLDRPSGVSISPPRIQGQYNAHTAAAAASLLSASISANAFHAPPTTRNTARSEAEIEELTKTMSNEGVPREVAMSYAFSAMDEYMASTSGKKAHKHEVKVAEEAEEGQEEQDKGIDSWITLERAEARKGRADRVARTEEIKEDDAAKAGDGKERKVRVTFSEPFDKDKHEDKEQAGAGAENGELANGVDVDGTDEDEPVFELETDAPSAKPPTPSDPSGARMRTMVEDNLSRTFAADAPSHRAAWRQWEARESMSTALRRQSSDDEDDIEVDTSSMARSVPVNIVRPPRTSHPVQFKTSLTDREGVIVPNLLAAMRRASGQSEPERSPSPRRARGSIAIAGTSQRRGSRTVSGERERDQVKSYAADPGAMFESLAEGAVSDSDEEEETPQNGKFVPPHVLAAKRDDKPEVGWRSLVNG